MHRYLHIHFDISNYVLIPYIMLHINYTYAGGEKGYASFLHGEEKFGR